MQQAVLFPTCVIDAVKPEVGMATALVLQRMGMTVRVPDSTTCCGQPAWNAGHAEEAAKVARTTLKALSATDGEIIVPAGSCTTMIRIFWKELFELEGTREERDHVAGVASRTFEFSEFVHSRGAPSSHREDDKPSVYHQSCHMLRELGLGSEPLELLDSVAGDRRRPDVDDRCCGFGGLFSVKLPEVSLAMADDLLDAYVETGAEQVVGCDASCLMHLEGRASRRGIAMEFRHLAEILEKAGPDT